MSLETDSDLLKHLEDFDTLLNQGISKVQNLLQEAWDHDDLDQIRQEMSQARQELELARNMLQQSQDRSIQELQVLELASSQASEKSTLLEQISAESNDLYLRLSAQEKNGRECLNSLTDSTKYIEEGQRNLNEILQRIESAENILLRLDEKQMLLLEIKNQTAEILNQIGGYDSINGLLIAIRGATERLQQKQMLTQALLEKIESLNYKINNLITEQCKPWWWPSNWWWRAKISFTARRVKQLK